MKKKVSLYFNGTKSEKPAWLHDRNGSVYSVDEDEAKKLREVLYSGEEEIDIKEYDGDAPTRGLKG